MQNNSYEQVRNHSDGRESPEFSSLSPREYLFKPRFAESNLISKSANAVSRRSFEINQDDLKIGDLLGKGAFGKVMKGTWRGKPCVAKMLQDNPTDHEVGHSCLLIEMAILSGIGEHPNLVSFYGACIQDMSAPIIVQELIEGPNLHDHLNSKRFEFNLGTSKVAAASISGFLDFVGV